MRVWSEGPLPWELLEAIHKAVRMFSDFGGFVADSLWILGGSLFGFLLDSALYKSWLVPHLQDHWRSEALRRGRLVMRDLPLSRCRCSMVQQPIESNWAKCSCSRLCSRLRSGLRSSCSSFPRPSPSPANVAISLRSPSWDPQHVTSPSLLSTRASRSRTSLCQAKDWQRQDCSICAANVAISSVSTETTRNNKWVCLKIVYPYTQWFC